jgi:hypothetical protein
MILGVQIDPTQLFQFREYRNVQTGEDLPPAVCGCGTEKPQVAWRVCPVCTKRWLAPSPKRTPKGLWEGKTPMASQILGKASASQLEFAPRDGMGEDPLVVLEQLFEEWQWSSGVDVPIPCSEVPLTLFEEPSLTIHYVEEKWLIGQSIYNEGPFSPCGAGVASLKAMALDLDSIKVALKVWLLLDEFEAEGLFTEE